VSPADVIAAVLVVAGATLALLAGVGVLRFPDVLARMHAATKPATLGLVLLCIAAGLRLDALGEWTVLVLVVALQFMTAPTGAHVVARAVTRIGQAREGLVVDDHPSDPTA
jgi:multicomponent Na+:H+ antiporter subunit G